MVNGAIIVGTVFAFPGIGTLMVGAVLNRDFALIQASVFIVGIAVVLLNIIVDLFSRNSEICILFCFLSSEISEV